MILEPLTIVELAGLGLMGGFMAGLLGIGGGMVLVPFISWIIVAHGVEQGLAVKMAIATSMATIFFTSMSSVRAHHRRGMVRWDLVKGIAPGIMIGALIVSIGIFSLLKGAWLSLMFGVLVTVAALQMLLDRKPKPTRQMPGPGGQAAAGGMIGFLSGLLGAGGGFISVPFMTWCNVPIHNAVATSAALGFPIAVFNVVGYIASGWQVAGRPPLLAGLCLDSGRAGRRQLQRAHGSGGGAHGPCAARQGPQAHLCLPAHRARGQHDPRRAAHARDTDLTSEPHVALYTESAPCPRARSLGLARCRRSGLRH